MATFKSPLLYKAHRARPVYDGRVHTISGSILIPSGTLLALNDVIRMFRVVPNKCILTRAMVDVSTNLDGHATPGSRLLTGKLGYLKSADRAGTNLSTNAAGSAATEDDDYILVSTAAVDWGASTTAGINFGGAGDDGLLGNGGFGVFSATNVAVSTTAATNIAGTTADSRGYDANVMDVAITISAASSTATTADGILTVMLEFAGVPTSPSATAPYLYADRYNSAGVGSF